jgi:hypothetical protein
MSLSFGGAGAITQCISGSDGSSYYTDVLQKDVVLKI